ncbi:hypothetical protein Ctob_012760 [Chrysochromulina tobinii]|uniref:Uncharacterized protein n=1 Tax=Chrysochromulina tobinii TaxID=1460289 RepID=A0A0M0LSN0_9EUKA|nr:hypothetical protein Ctob_012760 [Chrysochromulina tobinii]|eukprot:KOO53917.1 hypothetical protein Ctob_012760 [Chrysochromulina sp. CCMP291]
MLADFIAQSLPLLVAESDGVLASTGNHLSNAHLYLEAVQYVYPAESGDAEEESGATSAELPGGGYPEQQKTLRAKSARAKSSRTTFRQPTPQQLENEAVPMQTEPTASELGDSAEALAYERALAALNAVSAAEMDRSEDGRALGERQLLAFVVDKVAGGAPAFKANKLPQILGSLVKEEYITAAVNATKKALDPSLRGHIEVGAFVDWWPSSKFATAQYENAWMRELNLEAMRTQLMSEVIQRQRLYEQLESASPLMARARGAQFTQLVHHKARALQLMKEVDASAHAEREAREAGAAALAAYAGRAEAMHRRLHNRSAAQTAEWLRGRVKKTVEGGKKQEAKQLVDAETKKVKGALDAMSDWLETYGKARIDGLKQRFDKLAERALALASAGHNAQVGGTTKHQASLSAELSAQLSRALDTTHETEHAELQTKLDELAVGLGLLDAIPTDEHCHLLCSELYFKQRQSLATLHAAEHAAVPQMVRVFVDVLGGPTPVEDSALGTTRVSAAELVEASTFATMLHTQLGLEQRLDALHSATRDTRQAVVSLATSMHAGGEAARPPPEQLGTLWKLVLELERQANAVEAAVREAVHSTSQHMQGFEGRNLPRAQAMLDAGKAIARAASAVVRILRCEPPAPTKGGGALPAISSAISSEFVAGAAGASEVLVVHPAEVHPNLPGLAERWSTVVVAMQAEQQKLVAAAEDMEQHSLDMQQLLLEVSEHAEGVMARFQLLVDANAKPLRHAGNLAALKTLCETYERASSALRERAMKAVEMPKLFARLSGQLQQQQDSINAWCKPLINMKQEFVDVFSADDKPGADKKGGKGSAETTALGAGKSASDKGVLGTTLDTNLGTRVALNLIKSLLASAEVKASAVLGHDAIVKRMSTVAALYEKRSLEQQTAKAEMGALEQLFELSKLSGEGGVERQALEDRAELLHETIASAVALEPPPKTPKAEKVAKLRPSADETPAKGGAKGGDAKGGAGAKGTPGAKTGAKEAKDAKEAKGGKGGAAAKKGATKEAEAAKEAAAKEQLKAEQLKAETAQRVAAAQAEQELAATKMQAAMRGKMTRVQVAKDRKDIATGAANSSAAAAPQSPPKGAIKGSSPSASPEGAKQAKGDNKTPPKGAPPAADVKATPAPQAKGNAGKGDGAPKGAKPNAKAAAATPQPLAPPMAPPKGDAKAAAAAGGGAKRSDSPRGSSKPPIKATPIKAGR